MNKRFAALIFLVFFMSRAWSQSPCENSDGSVTEIPEGTQALEELRAKLLTVMTKEERDVIKQVSICSPISPEILGVSSVVAFRRPDTGAPLVVFGYSAQVALWEIGRAIAIAKVPGIHASYLDGFIRYRSTPLKFHELPMTANEFAVRLGPPELPMQINGITDFDIQTGEGAGEVLIMFVLAHEFAHHVNKDVFELDQSDEKQREAEAAADKWAASKLRQLGIDPVIATVSMMLFNALEQQSEPDPRHPPPLERALALATESERAAKEDPAWIARYLSPTSTPSTLAANTKKYVESLSKLRNSFVGRIEESARLQTDDAYLKQKAITSTKARMDLGAAYARGGRADIPQDWALARDWMYAAQKDSDPYEYDYRADAQILLATYHAAPGGDMSFGCSMLARAAAVKHGYAQSLLKASITTGQCVPGP